MSLGIGRRCAPDPPPPLAARGGGAASRAGGRRQWPRRATRRCHRRRWWGGFRRAGGLKHSGSGRCKGRRDWRADGGGRGGCDGDGLVLWPASVAPPRARGGGGGGYRGGVGVGGTARRVADGEALAGDPQADGSPSVGLPAGVPCPWLSRVAKRLGVGWGGWGGGSPAGRPLPRAVPTMARCGRPADQHGCSAYFRHSGCPVPSMSAPPRTPNTCGSCDLSTLRAA